MTVAGSGDLSTTVPYSYRQIAAVSRERFERFPFFPPFRSETSWEDATFAFNLLRNRTSADFDALITCSFPFTHWALARMKSQGVRVFVTQNGDWPAVSNRSEYRTFDTDLLVCTNPDYFERNHHRWNCALIPNGVDPAQFKTDENLRSELKISRNQPVILMVSALIESKRVLDGIRAVSALKDSVLIVAGDGPLREDAQSLADELMPGRFRRVSLPAERMPALYASADVFLHLSLLESFGNVFLEAWASGLPIVGHDTARLRWILGDQVRFLCDTEDSVQLRNALRTSLAAGRGNSGHGIDRFSWGRIAEQYREAIERTIVEQL